MILGEASQAKSYKPRS